MSESADERGTKTVSRRGLLGGAAAGGIGLRALPARSDDHIDGPESSDVDTSDIGYVPRSHPLRAEMCRYLTKEEATLLDELAARILSASADAPGAHEARVVTFVDPPSGVNDLADGELERYGFQGSKTLQYAN